MDNPKKLASQEGTQDKEKQSKKINWHQQGTQDKEKQSKNTTQYATIGKQSQIIVMLPCIL